MFDAYVREAMCSFDAPLSTARRRTSRGVLTVRPCVFVVNSRRSPNNVFLFSLRRISQRPSRQANWCKRVITDGVIFNIQGAKPKWTQGPRGGWFTRALNDPGGYTPLLAAL